MTELVFKVSARTARLIGRENVANPEAAVIELVKNGYDADSGEVFIIFDHDDLYLIDDGHGMSLETIKNSWMVIGTDTKELAPKTPKGRIRSGAKGIGRFALDKLGASTVMYTLHEGQPEALKLEVSWTDFEKSGKTVDSVNATLTQLDRGEFKNIYQRLVGKSPDSGTILHIQQLREVWGKRNIDKLFSSLRSLVPPVSDNEFKISLRSDQFPKEYGDVKPLVVTDFDYKLSAFYDATKQEVRFNLTRNEFDTRLLNKKYVNVYKEKGMGVYPYDLQTFEDGTYTGARTLNEILPGIKYDTDALKGIGDFSFEITFAKNKKPNDEDFEKYPYKIVDYRERTEWLRKFGGIRIFRDNFRVRPYGENGDDWLRLGERQAQSPGGPGQRMGGYKVRPNQVTGSVYISRLNNMVLEDKSSREGIVENNSFELLKSIIKAILTILESDRNQVFFSLSSLFNKTNEQEIVKQRAKEAIAIVKSSKNGANKSEHTQDQEGEYAERIADYVEVLESKSHDKDEEIKILRSLASAGIITAAAAHELSGLKNHMSVRAKQFERLLEKHLKKEDFVDESAAHDPFKRISQMAESDRKIVSWMDYALMPLRRDRRLRNKIKTNEYFEGLQDMWSALLEDRKIKLTINSSVRPETSVKAFPIDLDTIFNNLLINSTEAFIARKSTDDRKILIKVDEQAGKLKITYEDNAGGLDDSFKKDPEKIFMPHVTTKVNLTGEATGTGMGMYLVKATVDENEGAVTIDDAPGYFRLIIDLRAYDRK